MSIRKSTKDYLKIDVKDILKLLCLALDQSKEQLFSNQDYELNNAELKTLDNLIKQRSNGNLELADLQLNPAPSLEAMKFQYQHLETPGFVDTNNYITA